MAHIPRTSFLNKRPRKPHISRFQLWYHCMMVSFLLFTPQPSCGLQMFSSSVSPTYVAVGESVTLRCHFKPAPEEVGQIDIIWSIKPADIQQEEKYLIWNYGQRIYHTYAPFGGRVRFLSPRLASGNASIMIVDTQLTDTNTYQCKVTKVPGIDSRIIHLNVMERLTQPKCYMEGEVQLHRKVAFRCKEGGSRKQGSSPIWYTWSINGTDKKLPDDAIVDSVKGDLLLTITREVAPGTLVCTAKNLVGMKTCLVTIRLDSADVSTSVAVTAATAVTAPMVLIIIVAIVFFIYKRRKRIHLVVSSNDAACEVEDDEDPAGK